MKRCSKCGIEKAHDQFRVKNKERGTLAAWCIDCQRAYGREHYRANREYYVAKARVSRKATSAAMRSGNQARLLDYLRTHPCVDCGETDAMILQFDHRDPATKRDVIGRLMSAYSWRTVLTEIEKCDVRCANCHRRRTAAQFGHFRWTQHTAGAVSSGPRAGVL